jgi:putative inorganic carbon (HCO3(-)) transporter
MNPERAALEEPRPSNAGRLRGALRRLGDLEPWAAIVAAPVLLFPAFRPAWTAGALALVVGMWLVRWAGWGRPGARTPLDGPLLLLAVMVPVAVWASPLPEVTLPKLTGLVLGLAAFRATVNAGRRRRGLQWATAFFLIAGLGMALLGLVSSTWAGKWPALNPLLATIPRLIQGLPGAEGGINPNELGGTLVLFLPVALGACWAQGGGPRWVDRAGRLGALLAALLFGAMLLLTQSRSAWTGAAVGLAAMAWLRWRWARRILPGLVGALLLGVWVAGPAAALETLLHWMVLAGATPIANMVSLEARVEIWSRALHALHDLPFTGCGLGVYRHLVQTSYPLFLSAPGFDIAHAHNLFLQVALDVGLPGLIGYLGLVGSALWCCWRVVRSPGREGGPRQWLALGLMGSLVAFHVYGLTDSVALGAKPGVALWMTLALAAVVWQAEPSRSERD